METLSCKVEGLFINNQTVSINALTDHWVHYRLKNWAARELFVVIYFTLAYLLIYWDLITLTTIIWLLSRWQIPPTTRTTGVIKSWQNFQLIKFTSPSSSYFSNFSRYLRSRVGKSFLASSLSYIFILFLLTFKTL